MTTVPIINAKFNTAVNNERSVLLLMLWLMGLLLLRILRTGYIKSLGRVILVWVILPYQGGMGLRVVCFLWVFLQRGDLYATGQVMESLDVMVQAIHTEISSKMSLEGPVGLKICGMTTDCIQPELKLGPLLWIQPYCQVLCKALNGLFIPLFKKKSQLGQWNRMIFEDKVFIKQMTTAILILYFFHCCNVQLILIYHAMKYACSTKYVNQDFSKEQFSVEYLKKMQSEIILLLLAW